MNLPLKWHGGKYYLASRIVSLMPCHLHYVEPFLGGGAVLLARDPEDPALWLSPHNHTSNRFRHLEYTRLSMQSIGQWETCRINEDRDCDMSCYLEEKGWVDEARRSA